MLHNSHKDSVREWWVFVFLLLAHPGHRG